MSASKFSSLAAMSASMSKSCLIIGDCPRHGRDIAELVRAHCRYPLWVTPGYNISTLIAGKECLVTGCIGLGRPRTPAQCYCAGGLEAVNQPVLNHVDQMFWLRPKRIAPGKSPACGLFRIVLG